MTPFVVDAGVAVKWFIREDGHEAALRLLDQPRPLHAPDLLIAELGNILWKKCVRGEIDRAQADLIGAAAPPFLSTIHASRGLIQRTLDLALTMGHPVYDCLYLACAEAVSGVLVTADAAFVKVVEASPLRHLVAGLHQMK